MTAVTIHSAQSTDHTAYRDDLAVAVAIGERLVGEAVWSGERCNWIGAQPTDLASAATATAYRALDAGLYGGTSGVALFLADLFRASGRDEFRRTAIGALRHALSRRDDIEPGGRLGFYVGWAGLAAAALRVGRRLDHPEFVDSGLDLLHEVAVLVSRAEPGEQFDLVAGVAGAVPALVLGHRVTGDERLATAVATAGDWLLDQAQKARSGYSWATPAVRNRRNLTGLSHGAAGAAVALIEAYRLTGQARFASGARRAMEYENRWYDEEAGNWPDFRTPSGERRSHTYVALWCHGAPGIALSRRHAAQHLGEARWSDDVRSALATTARTARQLADGATDFSLCHGLTGLAEPFLGAPDDRPDADGVARLVAEHGVRRYAGPGVAWPCGTHSAETPGLMLGLAGIGYFYLRLADPRLPSVLLPLRWDEA